MGSDGGIKRRRRAAPEPIAPGERKNVTFLASSDTYNLLVKASQDSGRSISDLLEIHLNKRMAEYTKPTFEEVFFGQTHSLEVLKTYALIFSGLSGPNDWRDNEVTRATINAAISTVTDLLLVSGTDNPDLSAEMNAARRSALRNAKAVGKTFGATLAAPLLGKILELPEADPGDTKKD